MEIDPQRAASPLRAQVCIIGAGIAGLTLASKLQDGGISVALLEAGGDTLQNASKDDRDIHVFGGNSLRWGGQLLPLPADAGWPIASDELAPYEREAQHLLGVSAATPFDAPGFFAATRFTSPHLLDPSWEIAGRLSKWVPFLRRNLAQSLGRQVLGSRHVTCYLQTQATELVLAPDGSRLVAVRARKQDGTLVRFEAGQFVLAAGTVETCRLLLASRSVVPTGIGNAHGQVGHNLHDHITVPVAEFSEPARRRIVRQLRPWLVRGILHSAKLEASTALRERLALPPVLAHLVVEEPASGGIAAIRNLLTARQRGTLPAELAGALAHLPVAVLEGSRLAADALLHHRRYISAHSKVSLVVNAAQLLPNPSRITLDANQRAIVDWRVTSAELAAIRRFTGYLQQRLTRWEGIAWQPALAQPDAPLPHLTDARHAMGGACMGTDPRTSVVDPHLRVHGVANLSIASAAVFPNGAPPLPSLPLMALTLRLAAQISKNMSS